jgi:hypothetical protein
MQTIQTCFSMADPARLAIVSSLAAVTPMVAQSNGMIAH